MFYSILDSNDSVRFTTVILSEAKNLYHESVIPEGGGVVLHVSGHKTETLRFAQGDRHGVWLYLKQEFS